MYTSGGVPRPEVNKIYLLCTTAVFISFCFKKFIMTAWLTLKKLNSTSKKCSKMPFRTSFFQNWLFFEIAHFSKSATFSKSTIFEKKRITSQKDEFFKIGMLFWKPENGRFIKKAAFSSGYMISYFWWICCWTTACIAFDMSWSVVTTCTNTIWKQWIIREELWWEWNTRIICLKKLVHWVLRKVQSILTSAEYSKMFKILKNSKILKFSGCKNLFVEQSVN